GDAEPGPIFRQAALHRPRARGPGRGVPAAPLSGHPAADRPDGAGHLAAVDPSGCGAPRLAGLRGRAPDLAPAGFLVPEHAAVDQALPEPGALSRHVAAEAGRGAGPLGVVPLLAAPAAGRGE